jgi:hypothetical protein
MDVAGAFYTPHRCMNSATCTNPSIVRTGGTGNTSETVAHECVCLKSFSGALCEIGEQESSGTAARGQIPLTFILAPILGLMLLAAVIVCVVFMVVARKKRATRGTYSPSRQELTSTRAAQMAFVLKQPPQEGLI